jgi:hypothetical protein
MDTVRQLEVTKASGSNDEVRTQDTTTTPVGAGSSHGGDGGGSIPVLVELLRPIPRLASEEPEAIMDLFIWLEEIYRLGLVDDKTFIIRILCLVSDSLFSFLGACLRAGSSWADCKSQVLSEYFPHFVRERMIRDLVVFHFHGEKQPLCSYVEQVFATAQFLEYASYRARTTGQGRNELSP